MYKPMDLAFVPHFVKRAGLIFLIVAISTAVNATILSDGRLSQGDFASYRALEANGQLLAGSASPSGIQGRIDRVQDPLGQRGRVGQMSIFRSDNFNYGGIRAELSGYDDPLGVERWYAWGFMVPSSWTFAESTVKIFQIHDRADADENGVRHPTLQVVVTATGKVQIWNAYDPDRVTTAPNISPVPNVDYTFRKLAEWNLQTDAWVDLIISARWAADNSGHLSIWKNGLAVFEESSHINTFNDQRGVWFKNGTYALARSNDWTRLTYYTTGVVVGDGSETLMSMSSLFVSTVPEPSHVAMFIGGLLLVISVKRKSALKHR